jgi:hypothetical protein
MYRGIETVRGEQLAKAEAAYTAFSEVCRDELGVEPAVALAAHAGEERDDRARRAQGCGAEGGGARPVAGCLSPRPRRVGRGLTLGFLNRRARPRIRF